MSIRIINRSLDIPISERNIGHTGDNLVEVRIFELNRYYGNIDLSEFDFKLDTQAGDVKNIIDLDKAVSGDKIVLTWLIKESHLLAPGRMDIQIRAFKDSEEKWHSAQDYVNIQSSINASAAIPDPLPSEFAQMEQRITAMRNEATAAAQTATEQAGIVREIVERAESEVLPELTQAIVDAGQAKGLLDGSIEAAGTAKTTLDGSISAANTAKTNLEGTITQAGTAKGQLEGTITSANDVKGALDGSITTAGQVKNALDESIATGDLANFKAEFQLHKTEYATKQAETEFKIATVEKDLNDYQKAMQGININQEATQKVNGFSILSLPKNAANSQFSDVRIKGNTATNIVKNGSFEEGKTGWSTSGYQSEFEVIDGYAKTTSATHKFKGFLQYCSLQQNDKYYVRFKTKVDDYAKLIAARIIYGLSLSDGYTNFTLDNNNWATKSVIFQKTSESNALRFYYEFNETSVISAYLDDVLLINLTKEGLEDKTKEELDAMFPSYFTGTKSTFSAMRLKSVGKNLFNKNKIFANSSKVRLISIDEKGFTAQYINAPEFIGYELKTRIGEIYTIKYTTDGVHPPVYAYSDKLWGSLIKVMGSGGNFTAVSEKTYIGFYFSSTIATPTKISNIQIERGSVNTPYEPYTESNAYVIVTDQNTGEILEARSLPNGTKDEIRVSEGKFIKKIKPYTLTQDEVDTIVTGNNVQAILFKQNSILFSDAVSSVSAYSILNYPIGAGGSWDDELNINAAKIGTDRIRLLFAKGTFATKLDAQTWVQANPITLNYQLAEPIEIPVQVSGSIVSYPNGTIYIERILPDAGVYTDKITILHQGAPIKRLDRLSKVDFYTGVETELDVSEAVIAEDKLSFTHPDLSEGDIVFFEYEYDVESTEGETEVEYYDSRYVVKDDVTGKFYKWNVKVSNGTPIIEVVEV